MMKKIMAIVLSGLLIFSLAGIATNADEPLNLVFGFENDADVDLTIPEGETKTVSGWRGSATGEKESRGEKIKRNTEDLADAPVDLGESCLEFEQQDEPKVGRSIMYEVNLKANTTYAVSAWVKADDCGIVGLAGWGTHGVSDWLTANYKESKGKWIRLYATYTTKDKAVKTTLCLRQSDTGKKTLFDDVRLYEVTDKEYASYILSQEGKNSRDINGDFEDVTTRNKTASDTAQVLYPANWQMPGQTLYNGEDAQTYAVITSEKARSGKYSLKISGNTNVENGRVFLHLNKKLEVGKTYMITGWVLTEKDCAYKYAGGAGLQAINTNWPGAGQSSLWNNPSFDKVRTNTNGEWVPVRSYFIAPFDSVAIGLYCHDTPSAYTAYFDDISVVEVPAVSLKAVDSQGKGFTKLDTTKENKVKVYVNGVNTTDIGETAKSYKVVTAVYDKNGDAVEMVASSLKDTVNAVATQKLNNVDTKYEYLRDVLDITIPAGCTAKVFVFSDFSKISPVSVLSFS